MERTQVTFFTFKKFLLILIILTLLLSTIVFINSSSRMRSYASSESDLTLTATTFLGDVAGMNLSNYPALSSTVEGYSNLQSPHENMGVNFMFGNNVSASVLFTDNKLWSFKLYASRQLQPASKTLNDCVTLASEAMNNYGNLCNVTYARDASVMLSAAVQGQNFTV